MIKNILFDIDHTLIDTNKARLISNKKLANYSQIKLNKIIALNNKYISTFSYKNDFKLGGYLTLVAKELNLDPDKLNQFYKRQDDIYEKSLYPEVKSVLSGLKNDYDLGIYSEGNISLQIYKLKKAKIIDYFSKKLILIFKRKLTQKALESIPANTLVLDDNLSVIQYLLKRKNKLIPVWVNRKVDTSENVKSISDIKEVRKLLKDL